MSDVYEEIKAERSYQNDRWGTASDDSRNTPWMWAAYIAQYATKWMRGSFAPILSEETNAFRTCMIKVASIAVAAVESIDRQRAERGQTFFEEKN